ncbi:type II secretion system protein [Singulisphaera acidiphila]|uniref:Prepilin-type N-terminal cleavage/methylation domain-containing protein n=1 Tax=Singulisphaera acidiphila (strain ATCC BAA-1392 / DSM 18658 / VKM B-2454 / MOB10) TaxID=886293 RepID=L0DMC2_SINAD|nr:prepilin-type N-terminal cleavage/methylation domain-containing protein [Singulisphaera acidiphila]AGA30534.1 prepilin-type N-terminal cleavage/methylation domain-containing protein [Singulisphaera acidiphila DSM 18658]
MRRRTRSTAHHHRLGFTLIELLVVIVILGLLVGLLVPAVMQAVGTAKDAAVAAEIRALSQALADFNSKYGAYPPSRIVLREDGNYSSTGALGARTVSYLRRFWPRMPVSTTGAPTGIPGGFYDFNRNGKLDTDVSYILSGPECLVFFLGGIAQGNSTGGWSMTGFSKNPLNPFEILTTNRTVPLFEFNNSRLEANKSNGAVFPGYLDSLGNSYDSTQPFYCYFSAYGGAGYDPGDVDFAELNDDGVAMIGAFKTSNAATPPAGQSIVVGSPAPNPYTNDPPVPTQNAAGKGDVDTDSPKYPAWQNGQTFQIISAGRDRRFGIGGQYLANGNNRLPFVDGNTSGYLQNSFQTMQANATVTSVTLGPNTRSVEKDNITNFSAGKLD